MQRHDGLAGARTAADARRAVVVTGDQLGLRGVQEHLPPAEVLPLQRLAQLVVRGGDDGGRAGGRGHEVVSVDGLVCRDRRGDLVEDVVVGLAVVQAEQHLAGELRRVLDEAEKLVLGRQGPDDRDQRAGHAQIGELLVGPCREQGGLRLEFGDRWLRRFRFRSGGRLRGRLAGQDPLVDGLQVDVLDAAADRVDGDAG